MSIKNIHKIEQPREKLEKYGPEKLSDPELLAILLRTGPKGSGVLDLSKKILRQFPQNKLANASFKELKNIHGLGPAKACEIIAMFELGRRLLKDKQAVLILSPREVWEQLKDIKYKSENRWLSIISKEELRKSGISSPDVADAHMLTCVGWINNNFDLQYEQIQYKTISQPI